MAFAESINGPVRDSVIPPQPEYREFQPGPPLADSIVCFWTSTASPAPRTSPFDRVLPDGCMDLLFDFTGVGSQRASVVGTMTRPLAVATAGPVNLLGVRFRPGSLSRLFDLNAAELTDTQVDLTHFWGELAGEVWHRLGEATAANRIRILRELLNARAIRRTQPDPFVDHCVAKIEAARGSLPIANLEKLTGLSGRQLERKFARHLGVSPKTFARIVRFKAVLAAIAHADSPGWVSLACDFGFADQSHLVREFKAFSGHTPTDYLQPATRRRMSDFFKTRSQLWDRMPADTGRRNIGYHQI